MSEAYFAEKQVAIAAVRRACALTSSVFNKLVRNETLTKDDKSPVTGESDLQFRVPLSWARCGGGPWLRGELCHAIVQTSRHDVPRIYRAWMAGGLLRSGHRKQLRSNTVPWTCADMIPYLVAFPVCLGQDVCPEGHPCKSLIRDPHRRHHITSHLASCIQHSMGGHWKLVLSESHSGFLVHPTGHLFFLYRLMDTVDRLFRV